MNPPDETRRTRGPLVALFLLAICGTGFFATIWNYTRNHAFAQEAFVESNDSPSLITASFKPNARVQKGQRVVMHIEGDSVAARGGTITNLNSDGLTTIQSDEQVNAPLHSKVTVSIDGTLGPQPVP